MEAAAAAVLNPQAHETPEGWEGVGVEWEAPGREDAYTYAESHCPGQKETQYYKAIMLQLKSK